MNSWKSLQFFYHYCHKVLCYYNMHCSSCCQYVNMSVNQVVEGEASGDVGPTRCLSVIVCGTPSYCGSLTSRSQSTPPLSSSRGSCGESRPTMSTATRSGTEFCRITTSPSRSWKMTRPSWRTQFLMGR